MSVMCLPVTVPKVSSETRIETRHFASSAADVHLTLPSLPSMQLLSCFSIMQVSYLCEGRLDGVLPGPLPGGGLIAGAVGLVDVCDLGNQRVVGVGVCEHGADREEHYFLLVI